MKAEILEQTDDGYLRDPAGRDLVPPMAGSPAVPDGKEIKTKSRF
jgi:hypothetical protein